MKNFWVTAIVSAVFVAVSLEAQVAPVDWTEVVRATARLDQVPKAAAQVRPEQFQRALSGIERQLVAGNEAQALAAVRTLNEDAGTATEVAETRRKLADELIEKMRLGTDVVISVETSLRVEQVINEKTSIWSDTDVRTLWDRIQEWGTILGTAYAAYALIDAPKDDGDSSEEVGIGVGAIAVSQALGKLLGPTAEEKVALFNMSVAAYDQLLRRSVLTDQNIEGNQNFKARLTAQRGRFKEGAQPTEDQYGELYVAIDDYAAVLGQLPALTKDIREVQLSAIFQDEELAESHEAVKKLKNRLDAITGALDRAEKAWEELRPTISISQAAKDKLKEKA